MLQPNPTSTTLPPVASYLVLVQPMLVAVDLWMTIADHAPRAHVVVAQCAAEADLALKSITAIHVAFLGLAPDSVKGQRLADAVRARAGRVVFIGDEADDLGPGPDWTVLRRPFSTACVIAALKGRTLRSLPTASAIRLITPWESALRQPGLRRHPVTAI